jgi:DNA primase catalytic subunit
VKITVGRVAIELVSMASLHVFNGSAYRREVIGSGMARGLGRDLAFDEPARSK